MSFEEFGLDGSQDAISGEALEKLAEQLRENSAHIKALRKEEKKQRAKDNKLVTILMRFVKSCKRDDLVALIARLLSDNVPASFILAIILLGNDDIQAELGIKLQLPAGIDFNQDHELQEFDEEHKKPIISPAQKIILNIWTESIIMSALENPYKILRTVRDPEEKVKSSAIQLTAFIIRDYFEQEKIEMEFEQIKPFAEITLNRVFVEVSKRLAQKQIEEGE